MLVVEMNEKVKAIRIPEDYNGLIKSVSKEYFLSKEQIQKIFFTYKDEEGNSVYMTNNEDFIHAIPLAEITVFQVEFKEDEKEKKQSSIDSLLANGNIDAIIEKANKRIIELTKGKKTENKKEGKLKNIKKVKINKKKECNDDNDNDDGGVKCSQCKEVIKGIRYMCGVCQKFNLCEECEKEFGMRHNHPLLKIRKPELTPIEFRCTLK